MIDIHCHILPDLDDGPKTLEESLELARRLRETGITDIIATPHSFRTLLLGRGDVLPRVRKLNHDLKSAGIDLHIWPGLEAQLFDASLYRSRCEKGEICHLGDDARWTLIEFPWSEGAYPGDEAALQTIRWLCERGTTPILAHPERIGFMANHPERIELLTQAGAWIQITVASLVGENGPLIQNAGFEQIERFANAFIATDSHGLWRYNGLEVGYEAIEARLGVERAVQVRANAQEIEDHLKRVKGT